MAPDDARTPLLVVTVLRQRQVGALGSGASTTITTYQLRAVTPPDTETSGELVEAAAAGLVTTPPAGARYVVPDVGTERTRYTDADAFFNAVATVTMYW